VNRRLSRKYFLGAAGALGVPLGSLGPRFANAAEAYTMRFNVPTAQTSIFGVLATHFASAVQRRTNGQIKVEVYTNGALGSQQESIDALITGVFDFTTQASSLLVPMSAGYQLFDLPFLFKDLPSGYRVLDGPIGSEIVAALEPRGLIGLGWGVSGMKVMETTNKAIVAPEDMKGLRMRIQGGPVFVATYQSLGAQPVVIDINEVFTALSQHTIDGLDVSLDSFVAGKWYTVAKHVALTNHVIALNPFLGSKKRIEALPPALQRIIRDEGRASDVFSRTLLTQRLADASKLLKENAVTFTQIKHAEFRKAVDPVYASVQSKLGGNMIERLTRAAG
jgi:TRAP-type transport system periplasmic protein